MDAIVAPKRSNSSTQYTITGSFGAVCEAIEGIFKQYHPLGYGTRVSSIDMEVNGSFTAQMSRANSCD